MPPRKKAEPVAEGDAPITSRKSRASQKVASQTEAITEPPQQSSTEDNKVLKSKRKAAAKKGGTSPPTEDVSTKPKSFAKPPLVWADEPTEDDLQVFSLKDAQIIRERIQMACETPHLEFEVNFGRCDVNNEGFTRVMNALSATMDMRVHDPMLDITPDGSRSPRITVYTKENIAHLCKTNKLTEIPDITAMNKTEGSTGTYHVEDYGINVNLRKEEPIDDVTTVAEQMQHLVKGFRMKQRVTFSSTDSAFQVDCTIVNSHQKPTNHIIQSGIFASKPKFEIEIEMCHKNRDIDVLMDELNKLVNTVLCNILNTRVPISNSVKDAALEGYLKLIHQAGFIGSGPVTSPQAARAKPSSFFIGPKPMTLSWENLKQAEDGKVTILTGYTVTDKADGERVLVYIDGVGRAFLIDSRLNVRSAGITLGQFANSILDGEYLDTWRVADGSKLTRINMVAVMMFDVYVFMGDSVAHLPLVPDRLTIIDDLCMSVPTSSFVQFKKKTFLYEDNMFENIATILNKDRPYNTDGLIFTPMHVGVGANYPNEPPNLRGRWVSALKWKPPEQNTIDFLVKLGAEVTVASSTLKYATLYVGSNESQFEKANVLAILSNMTNPQSVSQYVEREFATTLLPLKDGRVYCKNGDLIANNIIVEFSYRNSEWTPERVRHDKTQLYNSTKSITNTANDYNVARNVMDTIMYPVTMDMLIGKEDVSYEIDDDAYYMRNTRRDNLETKPMIDFHNYWVKNHMLFEKMQGKTSLFEFACGKGGDLMKWVRNGFKVVVGVDMVEDNLLNPVDGAYARLAKAQSTSLKGNEKYVFGQWDMSKPFVDGNQTFIRDTVLKNVTETIFGLIDKNKIKKNMAKYYNIGNDVFDVVSCQFAIHYMFESRDVLNAFADNVASKLRVGGYFVGTCMDGHLVDQLLTKLTTRSARGSKNGKLIWSITSRYDVFDPNDDNFGKKIDVYVESINQVVSEYLVDFDALVRCMEERGLKLLDALPELGLKTSHGYFKDLYTEMEKTTHRDYKIQSILDKMSMEEKQLSFLNKWFVFKMV